MNFLRLLIPAGMTVLLSLTLYAGDAEFFNIKAYGAKGDGATLDTDAINKAIEAAAAAGGGTVYFPAGKYMSHSIRLKSNITLYLEQGCVLAAAPPSASIGYDAPEPNLSDKLQDFGHSHWHNSLIWGEKIGNIAILGPGMIDGTAGLSRGESRTANAGNKAVALKECYNVLLRDIRMVRCGHFALLATGVNNLTLDNVLVDTNRDGFDIDGCENVRLSNCHVNAPNDDAIVLKSSYALGYEKACDNITITNCFVSGYEIGSLLDGSFKRTVKRAPDRDGPTGRIKFGTESNGGFKNITISNCVFDVSRGLALETVDGAVIENIIISNIVMRDVANAPFFLRLGGRMRAPEAFHTSILRNVQISNVTVYNADPRYASILAGLPDNPIRDVTLSNIRIYYQGGLSLAQAARQPADLINPFFTRNATEGPNQARSDPYAVPERIKDYPEPSVFGILPAYGFYIRHARNIVLRDIEIGFMNEDSRPAVVLADVHQADFDNFKAQLAPNAPLFVLQNVKDLTLRNLPGATDRQVAETEWQEIFPDTKKP